MAEIMVGKFVGVLFDALCGQLVNAIKEVRTKSKEFKPLLKQLESTVERITPIFEDIESLNRAVHRPETESAVFANQLNEGKSLVLKCAGVRWWNKSSYAKKLIEYDRSLTRFFQIDVTAQILHSVRRLEKDLAGEKKKKKKEEEGEKKKKEDVAHGVPQPEDPIALLRNSPQFLALRPLLQRNPRLLKLTLQGLREKHPELLNDIKERKVEFLQLIYGPVDDDDISTLIEDHKDVYEELIDGPVDGSDGHLFYQHEQEMSHAISVILAEQEAVERLEEMGFDSDLVIEAFLACDGNEELAVNYLLENAGYFED